MTEVHEKSSNLPARASVGGSVGSSLCPQAHGGALQRGGTPEGQAKGGRVAAERRRARAERSEEIDDAMLGYAEKFLALVDESLKKAKGTQYRCPCGRFGPKVMEVSLRERADLAVKFAEAARDKAAAAAVVGVTVSVVAGVQVVPNLPAEDG